jgi:membrane fusion protein
LFETIGRDPDATHALLRISKAGAAHQVRHAVPPQPDHARRFSAAVVRVGQDVRLLYDAFPYQNFGTYHGRIIRLSQII